MNKLTDKHFFYVLLLEMEPENFIDLMETNYMAHNLVLLDFKSNFELYENAKISMFEKNNDRIHFDFDYDSEPFIFNKYINGKLDKTYKICIFEQDSSKNKFIGKTSDIYCDGMPMFFDQQGDLIKNNLN